MQPTVSIPQGWDYPRYCFGQLTQQGMIVSMIYYPKDTYLDQEYDSGWRYSVLPHKHSEELYHYLEDELKPLSKEESLTLIQSEIESYQHQIAILQKQLLAVVKGGING